MNDEERRYSNCYQSMDKYGDDHGVDFGAVGMALFVIIKNIVDHILSTGGEQSAVKGAVGQTVQLKSLKREALREWASEVASTARGMVYAFPGIDELFRMPRNRSDADLLSAVRGFVQNGIPYDLDFAAYGLPKTWRADGTALADEFEISVTDTDSVQATSAGKTAALYDWVTQGARARRVLRAIGANVYADNPEKLAAWLTASHIEKRPIKKKKL